MVARSFFRSWWIRVSIFGQFRRLEDVVSRAAKFMASLADASIDDDPVRFFWFFREFREM
jgi:hypothetical protein